MNQCTKSVGSLGLACGVLGTVLGSVSLANNNRTDDELSILKTKQDKDSTGLFDIQKSVENIQAQLELQKKSTELADIQKSVETIQAQLEVQKKRTELADIQKSVESIQAQLEVQKKSTDLADIQKSVESIQVQLEVQKKSTELADIQKSVEAIQAQLEVHKKSSSELADIQRSVVAIQAELEVQKKSTALADIQKSVEAIQAQLETQKQSTDIADIKKLVDDMQLEVQKRSMDLLDIQKLVQNIQDQLQSPQPSASADLRSSSDSTTQKTDELLQPIATLIGAGEGLGAILAYVMTQQSQPVDMVDKMVRFISAVIKAETEKTDTGDLGQRCILGKGEVCTVSDASWSRSERVFTTNEQILNLSQLKQNKDKSYTLTGRKFQVWSDSALVAITLVRDGTTLKLTVDDVLAPIIGGSNAAIFVSGDVIIAQDVFSPPVLVYYCPVSTDIAIKGTPPVDKSDNWFTMADGEFCRTQVENQEYTVSLVMGIAPPLVVGSSFVQLGSFAKYMDGTSVMTLYFAEAVSGFDLYFRAEGKVAVKALSPACWEIWVSGTADRFPISVFGTDNAASFLIDLELLKQLNSVDVQSALETLARATLQWKQILVDENLLTQYNSAVSVAAQGIVLTAKWYMRQLASFIDEVPDNNGFVEVVSEFIQSVSVVLNDPVDSSSITRLLDGWQRRMDVVYNAYNQTDKSMESLLSTVSDAFTSISKIANVFVSLLVSQQAASASIAIETSGPTSFSLEFGGTYTLAVGPSITQFLSPTKAQVVQFVDLKDPVFDLNTGKLTMTLAFISDVRSVDLSVSKSRVEGRLNVTILPYSSNTWLLELQPEQVDAGEFELTFRNFTGDGYRVNSFDYRINKELLITKQMTMIGTMQSFP